MDSVPTDLGRPFLASLPVSGAAITVGSVSGQSETISASDPVSARIEELQFELGEGPQWLAAQSGLIVSIPDASAPHDRWPIFGQALAELPVGALFCIPMRMGAVTLGVATLYSHLPRVLTAEQEETALAIASAIAGAAAYQAMQSAEEDTPGDAGATVALRREVHQATGILIVQLDTTATIAYARLQAYAFANGRSIQEVAHDVVVGSVTLEETE